MKMVGINIKQLRAKRDVTLRELAKDSGVSSSFLSQVEKGKASPSLSTLKSIADALETTIGSLVGEDFNQKDKLVTREKDRKSLDQAGQGIQMYLLSEQNPYKQMEPLLFKLSRNSSSGESVYSHYGQEFVLVLKGELEMMLGDKSYFLKKGDSIYFNSSTPHSFKNLKKGDTEALWVVTPPSF